jgi:hypothetical protein
MLGVVVAVLRPEPNVIVIANLQLQNILAHDVNSEPLRKSLFNEDGGRNFIPVFKPIFRFFPLIERRASQSNR